MSPAYGPPAADKLGWPSEDVRWATTNVPRGRGIRLEMLAGAATLIVTGGWNDEYEAIAGLLADQGAEHRIFTGAAHRPQDVAGFAVLVDEFERARLV